MTSKRQWVQGPETLFTARDTGLAGGEGTDPLGLMPIWREFAHRVFGHRLTRRTPDLRLYSINLFHHSLVRWHIQGTAGHSAGDPDRVRRLILRLEAMLAGFFAIRGSAFSADGDGIPGAQLLAGARNAGRRMFRQVQGKEDELLVNQYSAGIDGRHRGPFRTMGLLRPDASYSAERWEQVDAVIESERVLRELATHLRALLADLERAKDLQGFIERRFAQTPDNLGPAYATAFGGQVVPQGLRNFWREELGFNSTPQAAAVYAELKAHLAQDYAPCVRRVVQRAHDHVEESYRGPLAEILRVAPFLTVAEWCLKRICYRTGQGNLLADLKQALGLQIADPAHVPDRSAQLVRLKQVFASRQKPSQFLRHLHDYHRDLMNARDGSSEWFQVSQGQVQVFARMEGDAPSVERDLQAIAEDAHGDGDGEDVDWWHDFYVHTVWSLCRSIEASGAAK